MSAPISLKCPNCAAPLRHEDWNISVGVVKCSHCGALSTLPGASSNQGFVPRAEVPMPPRITLHETPLGFALRRRWLSAMVFFLIPFCIVWDGFLIFWYTMAFTTDAPWIFKLFPIAHLAVGVGLTYFVIATLFNSTTISAASGRLKVAHGPIPWTGQVEMEGSDVTQLFCKERVHRQKRGQSYTYEVWAVLRDTTTKKLVSGMEQDQALFIEQKLEKALGIQDRPVPGELPR